MEDETNIGELWVEFSETAGLNEMKRELTAHNEELKRLNAMANRMHSMAKRMIGIYVGYEVLNATILKAVNKAADREKDLLRLEAVLTAHGIKGRQIVNIYQDMAKSISDRTKYTTTQALRAQEILTTMGIAPKMMQEALDAAVQLSSRTGNLESSAQMIGQALEGNMKSIGKVVLALRGVKDASPQTIFETIHKTYGDIAEKEIEGYVGQKQKLQKVYDALMLKTGRFLEPYFYRIVKAYNQNPRMFSNLTNPAGFIQSIIESAQGPEWTASIGRHKDDKILLDADKQFKKVKLENDKKNQEKEIDLRELWIKAMAEQYAEAEEANEKWFAEQKAFAEKKAKDEYDLNMANSEGQRKFERELINESFRIRSAILSGLNHLESRVLANQYNAIYQSLNTLRSLSSSQYSDKAIHGLERIVNAENNYYSRKLEIDKRYYEELVNAYRVGLADQRQLDIAQTKIYNDDLRASFKSQSEIALSVLESMSGLFGMAYEATGNDAFFYVYRAMAIAETIYHTVSAAREAYDIGEDIPYVGVYLKYIFMAIAIAVGAAKVASILSTTPGTRSIAATDYGLYESNRALDAIIAAEEKPWNPTIKWHILGQKTGNGDFAREILPYVQEARADMVH